MPTDALFIHSAGPQSGEQGSAPFVKALRRSLGPAYELACPAMPAPTKPSYERWKTKLDRLLLPNGEPASILIGHSLGGSVLLKYLSERQQEIRAIALFVVAAPYWRSKEVEEFALREGFARSLPDALAIYLYQSQDDEVIGMEHLSSYSEAIAQAIVRRLQVGGHTFKSGLPELVEDIRRLSSGPPAAISSAP